MYKISIKQFFLHTYKPKLTNNSFYNQYSRKQILNTSIHFMQFNSSPILLQIFLISLYKIIKYLISLSQSRSLIQLMMYGLANLTTTPCPKLSSIGWRVKPRSRSQFWESPSRSEFFISPRITWAPQRCVATFVSGTINNTFF